MKNSNTKATFNLPKDTINYLKKAANRDGIDVTCVLKEAIILHEFLRKLIENGSTIFVEENYKMRELILPYKKSTGIVWVCDYGPFKTPTKCKAFGYNDDKLVYVRFNDKTYDVHFGYVFEDEDCVNYFNYHKLPLCKDLEGKEKIWLDEAWLDE